LGGEKLKKYHPPGAVFAAAFIFMAGLCAGVPRVSAQSPDTTAESALLLEEAPSAPDRSAAESALILGDAPGLTGETGGSGSIMILLRMVLVLALAAAAIYGVVFFLKRAARPRAERNPYLKILTSASLGGSRSVYVVSLGAKAWLLGAGESGVSLIAELTDQEILDALLLEESRRNAEGPGGRFVDFRAMLRRLGGERSPGTAGGLVGFSPDKLRKRRERLKGL
jgi:flagellar protein FliO/FliZ